MLCAFLSQGTRLTPLRGKRCHYFLTACTRQYLMMIMTIVMMVIWLYIGAREEKTVEDGTWEIFDIIMTLFLLSLFFDVFTDCNWSVDAWWRTGLVRKPCKFETKQINPCLCRALAKLHRARASFKPFAIFFGQGDSQKSLVQFIHNLLQSSPDNLAKAWTLNHDWL